MTDEVEGLWMSESEVFFGHALRAFLKPVINNALLWLGWIVVGAVMHVWVFHDPVVATGVRWLLVYGVLQVCRGLWWLYQPRWPWRKTR